MPNRQGRGLGKLAELNTKGQVSTKPTYSVDHNAGAWFAASRDLRRAGQVLGGLIDRAMAKRKAKSIEAGKTQGYTDGFAVDLGTGESRPQAKGELASGIEATADALQIDPVVLATAISYETGGTFDPLKKGPTTKWGQHRGLIQFGEQQAKRYGVDWNNALASQLGPNGAIARYLKDNGVKPGMGLMDVYSAINAGEVGRYNASDEAAGGAPGTVRDKVADQMEGHRLNAERLFAGVHQAGTGRPGPSGPALALRRDKAVMGEAYQQSLDRSIARRYPIEISQQLDALYDDHKDDPAALSKAIDDAEVQVLERAKELSSDPAVPFLVQEAFSQKRKVYEKSARAEEDKRVRDGERADYDESLSAARTSLQKQAYLAGDDEEAGSDLQVAINEKLADIEASLQAGLISPEVARRDRKTIEDTVTVARVDGVFDSLPDSDAKEAFVEGMKEEWANGEGILKDLTLEQVQSLDRKYSSAVAAEKRETAAAAKLEGQQMKRLLADDLASISQTGVGVSVDGEDLTFDKVKATLGEATARDWQRNRTIQSDTFKATNDLDLLPIHQMMARLQSLEPDAGSQGYADKATVYAAAQKEIQRISKLRKDDPARAVDAAFEKQLDPLREQAYGGDLVAMEELIKGRLDAQDTIGIPDYAQAPLTNSELEALATPMVGELDRKSWTDMFAKLDEIYGPFSDDVMAQMLQRKGLHKDAADMATGLLRSEKLGDRPSRLETRTQQEKLDASSGDVAMSGQFEDVQWKAMPKQSQINLLLDSPELANRFDEKFGAGAARFYLNAQEESRLRTEHYEQSLSNRGISINPDGSEDYDPAKDKTQ